MSEFEIARSTSPAGRAAQREHFLAAVDRAPGIDDYVPLDARLRAEIYASSSGRTEYWPIPITYCT